jgi:hypothetical protein
MANYPALQYEKRNFMGIELDVLGSHPEHDLLFIANQVAHAAGLKDASHSTRNAAKLYVGFRALELLGEQRSLMRSEGIHAPTIRRSASTTLRSPLIRGD